MDTKPKLDKNIHQATALLHVPNQLDQAHPKCQQFICAGRPSCTLLTHGLCCIRLEKDILLSGEYNTKE